MVRCCRTAACLMGGGPSYDSCAAIWRTDGPYPITLLSEVGNPRRIWFRVLAHGLHLFVGLPYMPTSGGAAADAKWSIEIRGLRADISTLAAGAARDGAQAKFMLCGDFSAQPSGLGAGLDPSRTREDGIASLLECMNLALLNPSVGGELPRDVDLPAHGRKVTIRTGDTHHSIKGARAIQLAMSSVDLLASCVVHNSLHCASSGQCLWSNCKNYCKSDHFIVTASANIDAMTPKTGRAGLLFPACWHWASGWREGFSDITPALVALGSLAEAWRGFRPIDFSRNMNTARRMTQCILNTLVWLHCCLGNMVRVGRVETKRQRTMHPTQDPSAKRVRIDSNGEQHRKDNQVLIKTLRKELVPGSVPLSLTQKCFRWLRGPVQEPPSVVRLDGVLTSELGAHRAWCKMLARQCSGPAALPPEVSAKVDRRMDVIRGQA